MIGALCAIAWQSPGMVSALVGSLRRIAPIFIPLLLGAVLAGDRYLGQAFTDTVGLTFLAIAFGTLLLYSMSGPEIVRRILRLAPMTALGRYSYGIYVYHQPLYFAIKKLCGTPTGWPVVAGSAFASIGLAVLSYEFLEKLLLALKDKFPSTPGQSLLVVPHISAHTSSASSPGGSLKL